MVAKNISVSGYSLDKIYKKAIETINTGIYSKHVYSKTHSLELSKKCDGFILMEAAYVLFLDYFYELKNKNFLRKANGIHNALLSKLKPKQQNELLKMESRVAPFFQYEKKLAVKIIVLIIDNIVNPYLSVRKYIQGLLIFHAFCELVSFFLHHFYRLVCNWLGH